MSVRSRPFSIAGWPISQGFCWPGGTRVTEDIDTFTLRLAARLDEIAAIEPSSAAVARVRAALLAPAQGQRRASSGPRFNLWGRPAIALAFAVMLLAIGTTSVFAAPDALPNSPLYAV